MFGERSAIEFYSTVLYTVVQYSTRRKNIGRTPRTRQDSVFDHLHAPDRTVLQVPAGANNIIGVLREQTCPQ